MYLEVKDPDVCSCSVLAEPHEPDQAAGGHRHHHGHAVQASRGRRQHRPHLGVDGHLSDVGIHVGRREGQLEPARLLQKQVYFIYFISNLIIYFVYTGFTI